MKMVKESPANLTWIARVDQTMQAMFDEVLERGFHGTVSIELLIIDGTIHRITRSVERVEK